jgi:protein tyrosine phosphatase (PTP) superfamily phosphohydrolase (DUF442 family)
MRIGIVLATLIGISVGGWLAVDHYRKTVVWDHFDMVKPGILYRSGQMSDPQLRDAIRKLGLRTVVSFLRPGASVDHERQVCKQLGVDFVNLPMTGDGFGDEDQFREVLKACDDPDRRPVLVHCARGTCRTGAAVALYRYERDGWTIDDVSKEMERQAYRDGWLPGYVYEMVKDRASDQRPEARIVIDRNAPEPARRVSRRRKTEIERDIDNTFDIISRAKEVPDVH